MLGICCNGTHKDNTNIRTTLLLNIVIIIVCISTNCNLLYFSELFNNSLAFVVCVTDFFFFSLSLFFLLSKVYHMHQGLFSAIHWCFFSFSIPTVISVAQMSRQSVLAGSCRSRAELTLGLYMEFHRTQGTQKLIPDFVRPENKGRKRKSG